ncbi:unnamed protein product [Trichogramma brassicae]|uniref:Uncharacterized protein n=1 Tax=Trichogramma brassicae TaxID=86971 RepID=A0A6H5IUQ8_9HYME|nr:unnamed protein product [Trichogramma brassicae]
MGAGKFHVISKSLRKNCGDENLFRIIVEKKKLLKIFCKKNLYKNCGEKKIDFRKIGEAKMLDEKFQRVIYRINVDQLKTNGDSPTKPRGCFEHELANKSKIHED